MAHSVIKTTKARFARYLRPESIQRRTNLSISFVILIVILGALIRAYNLGINNLWFDEAMIWFISQGSFSDVIAANARLNSAPPIYPLLVGLVSNLWGTSEAQLRSLSLVAGIAAIIGIFFLARRWVGWTGAIVALVLMAFAPAQVAYSREMREYSFVSLFAILIFFALDWMLEETEDYRKVIVYTLVGGIALFFQFGLVIIVACAQFLYWTVLLRKRNGRAWFWFAWSSVFLASACGVVIASSLLPRIRSGSLAFSYLESMYLQEWSVNGIINHLAVNTIDLLNFGFSAPLWFVFGLLVAGGGFVFLTDNTNRRRALLYTSLPLLGVILLSLLGLYPYGGARQNLFLFPMFYIAVAAGVEYFAGALVHSQAARNISLVILLLIWGGFVFWTDVIPMYRPNYNGEHLVSRLEYLAQHVAPGDGVYVYWGAAPAFQYYWQERDVGGAHPNLPIVLGKGFPNHPERYLNQVQKCMEQSLRCWIVFSHNYDNRLSEQKLIIDWLRTRYRQEDSLPVVDVTAKNKYLTVGIYLFAR